MFTVPLAQVVATSLATAFIAAQIPLMPHASAGDTNSTKTNAAQVQTAKQESSVRLESISVSNRAWASCKYDFKDVPPKSARYKAITWLACESIAAPSQDGNYRPTQALTRGEAAVYLYNFSGDKHTSTKSFKDVKSASAEARAVSWMKAKGLTSGYRDGTFRPKNAIKRGEFALYLLKLSRDTKYKAPTRSPFKDVKRSSTYHKPTAWAYARNINRGYSDKSFRPTNAISRGDAAQFMYQYRTWKTGEPKPPSPAPLSAYVGVMWTKTPTALYKSARYDSAVLTTTKYSQRVELLEKLRGTGTMTKVRIGRTVGWINSELLMSAPLNHAAKPYSKPKTFAEGAANNISKWCWKVPIKTRSGLGGEAGYTRTAAGLASDDFGVSEYMLLGTDWSVNHPGSKAIQYHECAHVLQYRLYKYDYEALDVAMDKISGVPNSGLGVEYMADCMADAMGASREGEGYTAGYGQACSATQMTAAQKMLAGQKV